jgi:hypothetical protein
MCLTINTKKHKKRGKKYLARTTKRNLTVYKKLHFISNCDSYAFLTPFRNMPVKIGEKGSTLKAKFTYGYYYVGDVEAGIHAYTTKKRAISSLKWSSNYIIIKATIPKILDIF